jgi:hypothetical protein
MLACSASVKNLQAMLKVSCRVDARPFVFDHTLEYRTHPTSVRIDGLATSLTLRYNFLIAEAITFHVDNVMVTNIYVTRATLMMLGLAFAVRDQIRGRAYGKAIRGAAACSSLFMPCSSCKAWAA